MKLFALIACVSAGSHAEWLVEQWWTEAVNVFTFANDNWSKFTQARYNFYDNFSLIEERKFSRKTTVTYGILVEHLLQKLSELSQERLLILFPTQHSGICIIFVNPQAQAPNSLLTTSLSVVDVWPSTSRCLQVRNIETQKLIYKAS